MSLPRLRRRSFWLLTIAVWAIFFAARELLALERQALLALGTLCAARLHDRSRSAWWLCAALLPAIGALWLTCELALRRGSAHANRFGPDPREH